MSDDTYQQFLEWRGVESPCKKCKGTGVVVYGSTATWHGGIGGAAMTPGVCDRCWGSGDASKPWVDLRRVNDERMRLRKERDECRRLLREAVGECVQQLGGGWFVATLDDEWLAAARAAGGNNE